MPDTVQHVQGRHVRRCTITASGDLLWTLVKAALNAQTATAPVGAKRGDVIGRNVMGCRIVTASASFTVSNPDASGSLTIATTIVPYDIAAVNAMNDTYVAGGATLGVEVYYTGDETIP